MLRQLQLPALADVRRCRCGAELARAVGQTGPWTCLRLLLGQVPPGTTHDERDTLDEPFDD